MSAKRYQLVNRSSYRLGANTDSAIPAQQRCMSSQPSLHPSSKLRTIIKMKFRGAGCRSPHPLQFEISKVAHTAAPGPSRCSQQRSTLLAFKGKAWAGHRIGSNEYASIVSRAAFRFELLN